ncbi:hypothetical protein ABB37_05302 [Leptomonas pyrrhocoris]|uniref:Clu domain-containing protein n=1 Tax=Leptomonas pyrrhocoris TaxID=157538 RepID=A0A0M9G038_LEPPY|nr:hypothetical protein ABB37_05302 [Leptomonas pyrrhocoris]KPA79469.1 hypothetical protein ABB37_05302 [Leptomonas pyrrhocoris]|eukprot:XP_015657908.1 hypothetical protein ABB37_05302 [Leptomonas pyrrhocoris]
MSASPLYYGSPSEEVGNLDEGTGRDGAGLPRGSGGEGTAFSHQQRFKDPQANRRRHRDPLQHDDDRHTIDKDDNGKDRPPRPSHGSSGVCRYFAPPNLDNGGGSFFGWHQPTSSTRQAHIRTAASRRFGAELPYTPFARHRSSRDRGGGGRGGSGSTGAGNYARFSSHFVSSAMGIAQLGSTGPLSSHLLDWRVPSLSAEQELLQQVFATAYTDACYRCLISHDAATSFAPNETLQLVVDQWRAEAFDESQDTLQRVVEQYHHDLLQVVKAVVDAEDAALAALAGEMAGTEENPVDVSMSASMSGATPINLSASASTDTSLYQAFMTVGQANIPASIDCPVAQKSVLHYAMPALGRVLVHQGFFFCFWYSSTGEKIGQLEQRACRWVLEAHVSHVHVPLCYHFRYKGRGATAMSLAPLGDNLTTVTEQNPEVAAMAQQLASVFSLLPYGSSPGQVDASTAAAASAGPSCNTGATAAAAAAASAAGETVHPYATSFASPTRDRHESLSYASVASLSAASVDGEVVPDIHFLPRSVQVHFAQDGRYYFVRNSQWFSPWLNSRQSCDAAVQRLCYVNPRLLAVCGVQVSCRACQRDAFMTENRVALEFMRHEVDVGIPRLLHEERSCFVQRMLRRRRRAAAQRLQAQRAAHAVEAAVAVQHTTRVRVGTAETETEEEEEEEEEMPSMLVNSGAGRASHATSSDSDWTEEDEEEEDLDDDNDAVEVSDRYGVARQGGALPTALLPFTTTSVLRRFSARGYPKSLLGVLLLALLQYPAAPLHMVREVKREILFRGLKAFIRTRSYEARFGVEQLLGRLPHERVNEDDIIAAFMDASGSGSDVEDEGAEEAVEAPISPDTPTHHETPNTNGTRYPVASGTTHRSSSGNTTVVRGRDGSGTQRQPVERDDHDHHQRSNHNTRSLGDNVAELGEDLPPRQPAALNPLRPVPEMSLRSRDDVDHAQGNPFRPSFTQRWQQSAESWRRSHPINSTPATNTAAAAMSGDGGNAVNSGSTRQSLWGRLRSRLSDLRPSWFGGERRLPEDSLEASAVSPDAGNALAAETSAGHVCSQRAPSQQGSAAQGVGIQNPLAALHANASSHVSTSSSSKSGGARAPRRPAPRSALSSSRSCEAATTNFFSTWTDFGVTTERVLTAFMQYDGTAHPSHVFCDSTRRLYEVWELREKAETRVANAGEAASSHKDEPHRATAAQQKALEASLWSSADILNRMYVEQILPFIYRKFRLPLRRVSVLHDPLNEEDRASVYVRLLDALGVSIENGEVQRAVPVVMDFAPVCVAVPVAAGTGFDGSPDPHTSSDARRPSSPSPSNRSNDRTRNPLQRHGASASPSNGAPAATSRVDDGEEEGKLTAVLSSNNNDGGKSARSRAGMSASSSAKCNSVAGHHVVDSAHGSLHAANSGAPKNGGGTPEESSLSTRSRAAQAAHVSDSSRCANHDSTPISGSAHIPARELHYRLPGWIVWRAKALVHNFLDSRGDFPPRRNSSAAPAAARSNNVDVDGGGNGRRTMRHTIASSSSASFSARHGCDVEVKVGSAQVAGLVPLLRLLYNAPRTAFAADPHRPPLPPWPHVAARLLAQLRAVSVTPHLLWEALEHYELVDLRTLLREVRADGRLSLMRPLSAASPTSSVSPPSPSFHGLAGGNGSSSNEDDDGDAEENGVDDEERPSEPHSASSTATTVSSSSTPTVPAMPDNALHAPCCSLALALILRRRTLRSTSDRAILIQVLRRYVAAIRAFPALLCFLAPLHGRDERAAAPPTMWMTGSLPEDRQENSLQELAGKERGGMRECGAAQTAGVEAEAVYTAVLSTLQEVLLNADLLLAHFGNPFGAQYRQYTADLVGYLEYTMNSFAETTTAAAARTNALSNSSNSRSTGMAAAAAHPRPSRVSPSVHETERGGDARWSPRSDDVRLRQHGLREELDATLQHIWKQLLTYCKPDSMSARDALQQAVALFRMQESGVAFRNGSPRRVLAVHDGVHGGSSSYGNNEGGAAGTHFLYSRDPEIESALQRACDVFLMTDGPNDAVTMRAYCNFALYWYSVGCEAEWREWLQRLRRLWREGGPEDIRQLLMTTSTVNSFGVGVGGASLRTSVQGIHGGEGPQGGAASRLTDQMPKSAAGGRDRDKATSPIPFLQRVCGD